MAWLLTQQQTGQVTCHHERGSIVHILARILHFVTRRRTLLLPVWGVISSGSDLVHSNYGAKEAISPIGSKR